MGTNHYLHTNGCEHCGRYDELHIGKGWGSILRGHPDREPPIRSWADWRRELAAPGAEVWDEYGQREPDIGLFIALVESKPPEARRRHHDLVRKNYPDVYAKGLDWLDPEGFSFYGGEFS
jgi:hypothetical protein